MGKSRLFLDEDDNGNSLGEKCGQGSRKDRMALLFNSIALLLCTWKGDKDEYMELLGSIK